MSQPRRGAAGSTSSTTQTLVTREQRYDPYAELLRDDAEVESRYHRRENQQQRQERIAAAPRSPNRDGVAANDDGSASPEDERAEPVRPQQENIPLERPRSGDYASHISAELRARIFDLESQVQLLTADLAAAHSREAALASELSRVYGRQSQGIRGGGSASRPTRETFGGGTTSVAPTASRRPRFLQVDNANEFGNSENAIVVTAGLDEAASASTGGGSRPGTAAHRGATVGGSAPGTMATTTGPSRQRPLTARRGPAFVTSPDPSATGARRPQQRPQPTTSTSEAPAPAFDIVVEGAAPASTVDTAGRVIGPRPHGPTHTRTSRVMLHVVDEEGATSSSTLFPEPVVAAVAQFDQTNDLHARMYREIHGSSADDDDDDDNDDDDEVDGSQEATAGGGRSHPG